MRATWPLQPTDDAVEESPPDALTSKGKSPSSGKSPIDADAGSGLSECHDTTLCIAQGPLALGSCLGLTVKR